MEIIERNVSGRERGERETERDRKRRSGEQKFSWSQISKVSAMISMLTWLLWAPLSFYTSWTIQSEPSRKKDMHFIL